MPPIPPVPTLPFVTQQRSDSLLGSLCREIDGLRRRWRQVVTDLARAQEDGLIARLRSELVVLQRRRQELQQTARVLQRSGLGNSLSVALFGELTRRPLSS
jgi:hypothetical protein